MTCPFLPCADNHEAEGQVLDDGTCGYGTIPAMDVCDPRLFSRPYGFATIEGRGCMWAGVPQLKDGDT